MRLLAVLFLCFSVGAFAKDYGVIGKTYPIAETDMLVWIKQKLGAWQQSGKLAELQETFKQKSIQSIKRPKPVAGITKAVTSRSFTYDPTITVEKDIRDHSDKLIHAAGTKINPLAIKPLTKTLLFFNGDDEGQLEWARDQIKNHKKFKLILVAGSPIDLMNRHQTPLYFDQGGFITSKLGITHVPARVVRLRADGVLLIEEIAL